MSMSTTPYTMFSNLCGMARRSKTTFLQRIQYILDEEGIKRSELARRLGVGRATITEWMKGRSQFPRLNVPFLIEDKLGYSARWVATGQGEPKKPKFDPTDTIILESLTKLTDRRRKNEVREFVDFQINRASRD